MSPILQFEIKKDGSVKSEIMHGPTDQSKCSALHSPFIKVLGGKAEHEPKDPEVETSSFNSVGN